MRGREWLLWSPECARDLEPARVGLDAQEGGGLQGPSPSWRVSDSGGRLTWLHGPLLLLTSCG